ncbi:MAG: protease modulator HflC [Candidatus Zixiibacteriota bacterium]
MTTMKTIYMKTILGLVVLILLYSCFFTVQVTEYAVVTMFGKPIRVIYEPGLKLKVPVIQRVYEFDNRLQVFDPPDTEFLTLDKKNIIASSFMVWKIADPLKFWQSVLDLNGAQSRLLDVVSAELGAALGEVLFSSLISTNREESRLREVEERLTKNCRDLASRDYGIEIADVRLRRLSFPEQNKESVFNRMRAERGRIAKKFRSEGEEEATKIRARADRERAEILAAAEEESKKIRGTGEAEATKIYAQAFRKNPEFYDFLRTLEAYENFIDEKTTVVLPADAELMRLLGEGRK